MTIDATLLRAPAAPASRPVRRFLTILIADVSNSTRLAAALEAEEYAELLAELRGGCTAAIERAGGMLVRIDGDGLIAILGYPVAREDDTKRAVEAALALRDLAKATRLPSSARGITEVALHTGINAGLVLFDAGDLVRGRFELLGDATNIASRLASVAAPNEILIADAALGRHRDAFDTSEQRHLHLRGRDQALIATSIIDRAKNASKPSGHRPHRNPMVGRAHELGQLQEALDAAIAGAGARVVAVSGAPGIGKTRLCEAFIEHSRARSCSTLSGYCEAPFAVEPLQPIRQLWAQVAAAGDLELPGPPSAAMAVTRLCGAIAALAARRPLVIWLDDWQWADSASEVALDALAAISAPVLILLAGRSFAADRLPASTRRMTLGPLAANEVALVADRLVVGRDPFLLQAVQAHTGGNPLFVEELCHALAAGQRDPWRGGTLWLENLISSRFAQLPPEQAELLKLAAVIGTVVPVALLAQLTEISSQVLDALSEADFVMRDGDASLRFKHGITRDVVYQSVGLHERRRLHLEIAAVLQQQRDDDPARDHAEALAYHYAQGDRPELAAYFAERAGDKAFAIPALDRAQAQYRRALDALDLVPAGAETRAARARLVHSFGMASLFDPARDQLPVFEAAAARAGEEGNRLAEAWAEYWQGCLHYALGEPRASIRHCRQAAALAAAVGEQRLTARASAMLGQAGAAACDYAVAEPLLQATIAEKRSRGRSKGPPIGLSYALSCFGFMRADQGLFEEADCAFEDALKAVAGSEREIEGSVLTQRSAAYLWQERWLEAERCALQAAMVSERVRTRYLHAMSRALAAFAVWRRTGATAAIDELHDATACLERTGCFQFTSLNYGWLAEVMADLGRGEDVRRFAGKAVARARKGDRLGLAMAYRALARSATPDRAPHYLRRAARVAEQRGAAHERQRNAACARRLGVALQPSR